MVGYLVLKTLSLSDHVLLMIVVGNVILLPLARKTLMVNGRTLRRVVTLHLRDMAFQSTTHSSYVLNCDTLRSTYLFYEINDFIE